jgi:hypothetical protein
MIRLLIVLLGCLGAAQAGVYKWTDEHGKVHYGDRPTDKKAEQVTIKPGPANGAPQETIDNQRAIDNWLKARGTDREINKKKQAELAKQKAIQKRKCNAMKADLADMQRGGVVWYELDDAGKRRYFSESEIKQQISDLSQIIKNNCR